MKNPATSLRRVTDLVPDSRNANKGTKRGAELIARSLKDYGAGRSILLDKKGRIIAGNKTTKNAAAAGIEDLLVVRTDGKKLVAVQRTDLDLRKDKAARELAIADNRSSELDLAWDAETLSHLDLELDKFWTDSELQKVLGDFAPAIEAPEPKLDKAAELQKKWQTARGQIWEIGKHRLMCGDSSSDADAAALLGKVHPEFVFTSFPYAVGLKYRSYEDTIDNLRDLLGKVIAVVTKETAEGAFFTTNFADIIPGRSIVGTEDVCEYPMALEYWPRFRDAGWMLHTRRVWVKPIGAVNDPWTANSSRGSADWEHLWTWKKTGIDRSHRSPTSVFGVWHYSKFQYETNVTRDHAGAFPVYLAGAAVPIYTDKSDSVWEPFSGSGSTLCACEKTERRCLAMEIDPGYVAVALERLEEMGLTPKLVHRKRTR